MGHGKLAKFAEMATFPNVVQEAASPFLSPADAPADGSDAPRLAPSPMRGRWAEFFAGLADRQPAPPPPLPHGRTGGADAPLVLELGCGRGEYTVGLARQFPEKNFVGVDIKGARMWHGARQALTEGIANAAFLRTHIEFIDRFFAPGEVSELWLTFSDPQMKKPSKRLTSSHFLRRYRRFLRDGGLVHLKTDSHFLFTYTRELLRANGIAPEACVEDVYNMPCDPALRDIQTYYEQMWLQRGIPIKYLRFRLPQHGEFAEPDVEIPLDDYRSYNRHKRSPKDTGR